MNEVKQYFRNALDLTYITYRYMIKTKWISRYYSCCCLRNW